MRGGRRLEGAVGSRMAEEAGRGREVKGLLPCGVTAAAGVRNRRTRLDVRAERLLVDADAEATAEADARARNEEDMLGIIVASVSRPSRGEVVLG